jgi:peptidoglycan/xylan/chitin deacetylase (PgdA/CDA1 family)
MVDAHPDLVQREAAEGHEVANHTYHHLRLPTLPPDRIEPELRSGARAIERAIGSPTRLYRPPGGEYDDDVVQVTRRLGYTMVLWTDDPGDYANPGDTRLTGRLMRHVSNGAIILLHDGVQETLDVLPALLRRLKAEGYRFVTCSEMARQRGVLTRGGPRVDPPDPAPARP